MGQKVNIALIDKNKDKLSNMVLEAKSRLDDCSYADLRVTVREGQGAVAQDGMMKSSIRDYGLSYGLRVIAGKQILATGYFAPRSNRCSSAVAYPSQVRRERLARAPSVNSASLSVVSSSNARTS